ncbi:hypothetical protein LHA31_12110 (plasmid) [Carnobacterium viridans]|nr:hypothetical protein [Carnobacterium viridans]UDE96368.1 hypothetical protein LHA31_12110 [Carnobacterium viridans]
MDEDPLLESSENISIDNYIKIYKQRFEQKSKVKIFKKNDNKFYEQWYNLDGKTPNMRKLVEEIKDNVFNIQTHEFIYVLGSMEVHGIGAMRQLKITKLEDGFGYFSISKETNMLAVITPLCSFINRLAHIINNEYSTKQDNFYRIRVLNIKRHYKQLQENGYKL